jgi:hypothetical protein
LRATANSDPPAGIEMPAAFKASSIRMAAAQNVFAPRVISSSDQSMSQVSPPRFARRQAHRIGNSTVTKEVARSTVKPLLDGRQRLVRHGHLPERKIVTGIGPVAVRCPRVRDRASEDSDRIRFSSAILPSYARRSKSLEVLIPILYLKGVSTGDFEEALVALLGKAAGGLSASTIGRGRLV